MEDFPTGLTSRTSPSFQKPSLASTLPAEVLEEIFNATLEEVEDLGNSAIAHNRAQLRSFLFVCKAWVDPARTLLYRDVTLDSFFECSILFYETVLHMNPRLGRLVRSFTPPSDWQTHGSHRVLERILEALPALQRLNIRKETCKMLASHKFWNGIPQLHLYHSIWDRRDDPHPIKTEYFPSSLTSLSLSLTSGFIEGKFWNQVCLHNLTSFQIAIDEMMSEGLTLNTSWRSLPQMPSLRKLTIRYTKTVKDELSDRLVLKMILETALTLQELDFVGGDKDHVHLDHKLLAPLTALRKLTYSGYIPAYCLEDLYTLFPKGLQELNMIWDRTTSFSQSILTAFTQPKFLPNLTHQPRLTVYANADGWESADITDKVLIQDMVLAMKADKALKERSGLRQPGLLKMRNEAELPLLPCPSEYYSVFQRNHGFVCKVLEHVSPS